MSTDATRFAFVGCESAEQAATIIEQLHGVAIDRRNMLVVHKLTDIQRYRGEQKKQRLNCVQLSLTGSKFKERKYFALEDNKTHKRK